MKPRNKIWKAENKEKQWQQDESGLTSKSCLSDETVESWIQRSRS
jgi:hypothetical protein